MNNTKLTAHQNQQITDVIVQMGSDGYSQEHIAECRRLITSELLELNLATRKDALIPDYIPRTAVEAAALIGGSND